MNKNKNTRKSSIVALCIVSESELAQAYPNYSSEWETTRSEEFLNILYALGIDTSLRYERQDGLWHRNRLNKVVLCSRFVGHERQDSEWIMSGYASQEAKDKASGSRLLEDIYRAKRLTEDTQAALEAREKYSIIDESVQQ